MRATFVSFLLLAASLPGIVPPANAQGTLEDYRRAATVEERLEGLTVGVADVPTWIGDSHRFWYRMSVQGGHEFVTADAETQQRRPAFDHARLASALSAATGEDYTARTLPFRTFELVDDERALEADAGDSRYRCTLTGYVCERIGEAEGRRRFRRGDRDDDGERPDHVTSPDGRLEAFIRNHNVAVREAGAEDGEHRMLSWDGSVGNAYRLRSIEWSPDSETLVAYRQIPGYRRIVYFVLSSPDDQLQPRLDSMAYRKPGDVLDTNVPVVFHVESGERIEIDDSLFPNPYRISRAEWRDDSGRFTFEYNERGHQVYRVIEVDAETGETRTVISEEPETFFNYREIRPSARDSGRKFRYDIDDGREIIWMSERDGWNHLYMYDGETGEVRHQITEGEWVVRAVDSVDVANRQIWFQASGMNPDQDPYFVHHYRIDFDGTGLVAYTEANGDHTVSWSADRRYYVDLWSRVDMPPVLELRRTSDRRVLARLEEGDMSAQLATGWRPPEVFVAKGRDGETDIWGIIVRPTTFDPDRSYAVIENIYAGPQGSFVPKRWSDVPRLQRMAELGFVVVQIDGMGTSNRSKAFHDVAWRNLGDAGFPDRILWHRAVADEYDWYDITRVGITGGSAGGQNSTGGVLFHPDFYKVAVSSAGCHDNRMDKIWWNEHWMGWPLGPHYEASSNTVHAHRLEGKLLLGVGEHDTNVDPSSTMQLVDALIEAGKDFELYVQPGGGHGVGGLWNRRRSDFFVEHLLGVEPPDWNAGVTLDVAEDGEEIDFPASDLEPPAGFYESPDEDPPFTWW